jgi:DNA-binding NarL/FixJ family response regulator
MQFVIADRQPSTRSALKLFLGQYPSLEFAGESGDLETTIKLSAQPGVGLVLIEWEILGSNQKESIAKIKVPGNPAVLVLGCCLQRSLPIDAGADFYISKTDKPDRLASVIHQIQSQAGQ